jgi:hypothetical protein
VALRYKLRMFGVPVHGPANVFCDNNWVVKNTSIPLSMLQKSITLSIIMPFAKLWPQVS